MSAESEF